MPLKIRLATRDWDYLTPLALGDVASKEIDVELHRVGSLPEDLGTDPRFDAGEVSFSRYSLGRARGETAIFGVPHFLMRGFRQRCILVRKDSPLTRIVELSGKAIGLTGWQDSGNTWTRALLRRVGIGIEDARWYVGRLTAEHPVTDRLGGYGRPGRIEAIAGERPMVELLASGELDAIFTPFLPAGFFDEDSPFRFLLPDFRQAEVDYFHEAGYVPGIHLLGLKAGIAAAHPWLGDELSALIDRSSRMWLEKRIKYADTTPWIIDELRRVAADLPASWDRNGLTANRRMIDDFAAELHAQALTEKTMTAADLFPSLDETAAASPDRRETRA